MRRRTLTVVAACLISGALPAVAQVKQTKEQMMIYMFGLERRSLPEWTSEGRRQPAEAGGGCVDRGRVGLSARTGL